MAANYGEAGELDRARRQGADIPPVYSGHNAYGWWGPPPGSSNPVVVVGYGDQAELSRRFTGCTLLARVDTGYGVENDEQGAPVTLCAGPVTPWPTIWPAIRHLG